jgi:hypothetical protein
VANTGFKGLSVRQTGTAIVLRAGLLDAAGAQVTSGTTTLHLFEFQSDGSLKTYDWNDNTFKATACTTGSTTMSHQQGNNSTQNTGVWTKALSTLTGFTAGAVYLVMVTNSGASPAWQWDEFQYGSAEGDLVTTGLSTGTATLSSNLKAILGTTLTESSAGQIEARFKDFFDQASAGFNVSTVVSTYAGADTSGTTTLLARLTALRAGLLDNLDATVSSRLASGSYTAPPTAASIADAVWDEAQGGHTTAGTFGYFLDAQVSAAGGGGGGSDPWATDLPGSYVAGQAGYILGTNLDAAVSTRSDPATAQTIDLSTIIPVTGNTRHSIADCLNAAWAQGFGKWNKSGTGLTIKDENDTLIITFTLNASTSPTSRTPTFP